MVRFCNNVMIQTHMERAKPVIRRVIAQTGPTQRYAYHVVTMLHIQSKSKNHQQTHHKINLRQFNDQNNSASSANSSPINPAIRPPTKGEAKITRKIDHGKQKTLFSSRNSSGKSTRFCNLCNSIEGNPEQLREQATFKN